VCTVIGAAFVFMTAVGLALGGTHIFRLAIEAPSAAMAYHVMGMVGGGLASMLMLIAGFGMWAFKPWGRIAGIMYGAVSVLLSSSLLVLQFRLAELDNEAAAAISERGYLPTLFALFIPCVTLYVLTRPHIRDAFRGVKPTEEAIEE
jgi:hypothetical protein